MHDVVYDIFKAHFEEQDKLFKWQQKNIEILTDEEEVKDEKVLCEL